MSSKLSYFLIRVSTLLPNFMHISSMQRKLTTIISTLLVYPDMMFSHTNSWEDFSQEIIHRCHTSCITTTNKIFQKPLESKDTCNLIKNKLIKTLEQSIIAHLRYQCHIPTLDLGCYKPKIHI